MTWKRAELGAKGLQVIDGDETPEVAPAPVNDEVSTPAAIEPTPEPDAAPVPEPETSPTLLISPATAANDGTPAAPEPSAEATPKSAPVVSMEDTPKAPAKKRAKRTSGAPKAAKASALDAAGVLAEEMRPMGCGELIGLMAARGYWTSPGGKTPSATLYSAILREPQTKGEQARFVKVGKGMFALRQQA